MNNTTTTQSAEILHALMHGRTLTRLDALVEFGCVNLPGRIFDLRQAGHTIEAQQLVVWNHHARRKVRVKEYWIGDGPRL